MLLDGGDSCNHHSRVALAILLALQMRHSTDIPRVLQRAEASFSANIREILIPTYVSVSWLQERRALVKKLIQSKEARPPTAQQFWS